MPVKKAEEVEIREGAEGSKYKFAGKCEVCGKDLWVCISHPLRDPAVDATEVAVFVPGSRNMMGGEPEQAATYCRRHDPTAGMRRDGIRPGDPLPGDVWQPQR